jgi:hypothetical protein
MLQQNGSNRNAIEIQYNSMSVVKCPTKRTFQSIYRLSILRNLLVTSKEVGVGINTEWPKYIFMYR